VGKTLFLVLGVLVVLLAYNVRADDVGCCCIGASQYAFRIQSYCTANFPGSTFIPDFTQGAWYLDVQEDYGDIGCTVLCSSNTCGNNSLDLGEQCDSSALPTSWNRNCTSLFGFTSGELGCSPYCSYDVSNCTTTSCGTAGCVGTPPAYCDGFNIIQNCTACPDCPFGFMCDPVSDTCAVTSEGCVNYNITYWYQDASGNPIQNCSACCLTGCNASNSPFCDNLPPPPPPPPTCTAGV
jgi:hypothetical protein